MLRAVFRGAFVMRETTEFLRKLRVLLLAYWHSALILVFLVEGDLLLVPLWFCWFLNNRISMLIRRFLFLPPCKRRVFTTLSSAFLIYNTSTYGKQTKSATLWRYINTYTHTHTHTKASPYQGLSKHLQTKHKCETQLSVRSKLLLARRE